MAGWALAADDETNAPHDQTQWVERRRRDLPPGSKNTYASAQRLRARLVPLPVHKFRATTDPVSVGR